MLANVSNEAQLRALGLDTSTDLRVVVVASVAGGTGSGAVIDAGYAISSLETPKRPDAVDLFLVLPSGYVGANKDRVFANGVATLSELEYAMRGNPEPPYVESWGEHARVARGSSGRSATSTCSTPRTSPTSGPPPWATSTT